MTLSLILQKLNFEFSPQTIRLAVRAAIAVTFSMLAAYFTCSKFPYWITMTTIILMQANMGASIGKSYQRIIATIFGLLLGLLFAVMVHKNIIVLYSIFPLLLFLFVYSMIFSYNIPIFIVSVILGIIFTYSQNEPWTFILWRIIDTSTGAIISIAAVMILFPTWAKKDFRQSTILCIKKSQSLFSEQLINLIKQTDNRKKFAKKIVELENILVNKRQNYDDASLEFGAINIAKEASLSIIMAQERIHNLLLSLRLFFANLDEAAFVKRRASELRDFVDKTNQTTQDLADFIEHKIKKPDFTAIEKILDQLRNPFLENDADNNGGSIYSKQSGFPARRAQDEYEEHTFCVCNEYESKRNNAENLSATSIFLYRNLLAYLNELKHIANAIKELNQTFFNLTST